MEETKEVLQKPYGIVYYVLNTRNGKCYVGQTVRELNKRWRSHIRDSRYVVFTQGKRDRYFYNALHKYGEHYFEVRTLLTVYSKEALDAAETYYIDFFQSRIPEFGYNSKTGGANGVPNEATRKKLSKAHLGKKRTLESILRVAEKNKGSKRTPEQRANISAGKTGKRPTPEARANQSAAQRGKKQGPRSDQARANLSIGRRGVKFSPQARENMKGPRSGWHYGQPFTEEMRVNMTEDQIKSREKYIIRRIRQEKERLEKQAPTETGPNFLLVSFVKQHPDFNDSTF